MQKQAEGDVITYRERSGGSHRRRPWRAQLRQFRIRTGPHLTQKKQRLLELHATGHMPGTSAW